VFKFLIRCLFMIAGIALLSDTALPLRDETARVDQHTSHVNDGESARRDNRSGDTSYTLHLVGSEVASCSVGYAAYQRLKDGDAIRVQSTRLFRQCVRVTHDEEVVEATRHWRWIAWVLGGVLIALGIGWLRADDEDGSIGLA
jgi:hypothetical protein